MAKVPLEIYNSFARIPRTAPDRLIRALDGDTAYKIAGAEMSPAFKMKRWDGKEHLLKLSERDGCFKLPTGLVADLLKSKLGDEFEVIDRRRPTAPRRELKWIGHTPREHQDGAIEAALRERGITTGRGLLNLPIRSGKTLTAGYIIHKLGLRTVFVVPSEMLLTQTVDEFRKFFDPAPVGSIGGGTNNPDWITVVTNQSLATGKYAKLLAEADLLFVDEAHHLEAPAWRKPLLLCDARYKIGLSATIYANKDVPAEQSAIWLKAATGPILFRVSMRQLIEQKLLVPPHIVMYPITSVKEDSYKGWSFATVYKKLIVENYTRNQAIASLVAQGVERGMKVLVDTGRTEQMKRIVEYLQARGVRAKDISGKTPSDQRKKIMADFRAGEIQALVGTILGEGVDIPELEMVVNAEGLKSKKASIQRMRNLTPSEGKTSALFVDFADLQHKKLAEHSSERLAMYKSIRGFRISVGEPFKLPEPDDGA